MYLAGELAGYLYISVKQFKILLGEERSGLLRRVKKSWGPSRPVAEWDGRWCLPEPEGSTYFVGAAFSEVGGDQQKATDEFEAELERGEFRIHGMTATLQWLGGAEKARILYRLFSESDIRFG